MGVVTFKLIFSTYALFSVIIVGGRSRIQSLIKVSHEDEYSSSLNL